MGVSFISKYIVKVGRVQEGTERRGHLVKYMNELPINKRTQRKTKLHVRYSKALGGLGGKRQRKKGSGGTGA